MESLQKVSHKLAEEMYKATAAQGQAQRWRSRQSSRILRQQQGGTAEEPKTEKGKDDVIDADFKASSDK